MKIPVKILCAFFFTTYTISDVLALPNCPSDLSAKWNNCFGTYTYDGGSRYVGDWKNNIKHGKGKLTYANGDEYVGLWKDDLKHGLGKYTWSHGDEYVGEWKNNLMHGLGTYTWSDGDEYEGEWKNGIQYDGDTNNQLDNQKLGNTLNELWKRVFKNDKSVKDLEIEDSKITQTASFDSSNNKSILTSTDEFICRTASTILNNKKQWDLNVPKYVEEAKKRGLSCGIGGSTQTVSTSDNLSRLTHTPIEKDFLNALYGGKALRKLFNVEIINYDGFFETETIYYAEVKAIIEEKKLPEELRKSYYRSFLRENGASFSEAHILAETMEILGIFNNGLNMFIDGSDTKNSDINIKRTLTAALRFGKGKNKWIYIPDEKVSIETNETYNTDFQGWVDKYSNF